MHIQLLDYELRIVSIIQSKGISSPIARGSKYTHYYLPGESKPSTITVLHLLAACYSLCLALMPPRSSHRVKNTVLRHYVAPQSRLRRYIRAIARRIEILTCFSSRFTVQRVVQDTEDFSSVSPFLCHDRITTEMSVPYFEGGGGETLVAVASFLKFSKACR